ncbi:MAG TPA: TIGR00730 family Rossman fold protein [Caulobacteraceae bacterium]
MADRSSRLDSVCVYCGSSDAADPQVLGDAEALGEALAGAGLRLVYGGGGVGLMGACARAAHEAGGRVLGVIPDFLRGRERPLQDVETLVVDNMHERKMRMFDEADAFVVLPGGIGTLEEVIELLSWRRLALHEKPVLFYSPHGYWDPLFHLFDHMIDQRLLHPDARGDWRAVERIADIVPTLREMATPPDELADKMTTRVA